MSADDVDDLHAAEDLIGSLQQAFEDLFDGGDPNDYQHLAGNVYCRPTCGFESTGECDSGGDPECGCPCGHKPKEPAKIPTSLAEVDLDLDCETHGHVFGLMSGSVRHCERFGCDWRDGLDPDDFNTVDGGLYDFDDPERDQLGYYGMPPGADAYVLRKD